MVENDHTLENTSDEEDDGLSVGASISSADTAELTQRIVAKQKEDQGQQTPTPLSPEPQSVLGTPTTNSFYMETPESKDKVTTPLDDISNTCADDDWSSAEDGANDENDSVDTATLERRIMARKNGGSKPNDPPDDEFVLPDDDSSSSSDDEEDEKVGPQSTAPQSPPTTRQLQPEELQTSNAPAGAKAALKSPPTTHHLPPEELQISNAPASLKSAPQSPPTTHQLPPEELQISNAPASTKTTTKAAKENQPEPAEEIIPPDVLVRFGLHRPPCSSSHKFQKQPANPLQDDDIEHQLPPEELQISNAPASTKATTKAAKENQPEPAEETIPPDVLVRFGLHRPPCSSSHKFRKQPANPLQDDDIEDSSSDDEARPRLASSRKQRASLPLVRPDSQKQKKGPLTQKTLSFASKARKKRSFPLQKQQREGSSYCPDRLDSKFSSSAPSLRTDHVPAQTNTHTSFDRNYTQSAEHDFSIVASAYDEDRTRYQPQSNYFQTHDENSQFIPTEPSVSEDYRSRDILNQTGPRTPIQQQHIMKKRSIPLQQESREGSSHCPVRLDPQFSSPPPSLRTDHVPAQTNTHPSFDRSYTQSADHDFSIVASAYDEDRTRYQSQPNQFQAHEQNSQFIQAQSSVSEDYCSREILNQRGPRTPIQQQRILNAFRRPDPRDLRFPQDRGQFGQQPTITMNAPEPAYSLQPHHDEQHDQPDFAITASAYEDIPYQPHAPPPAAARGGGSKGGRRIRDPSALNRRKPGKRRRRRPPARSRQPARGRRKAVSSRSATAPAEPPMMFPRAPDDHLNGVGGASIRF